ncbi:MAG: helix-turn-helix domain-containing protein [Candidatus Jettenia sp.]|uniref:Helix-turn-helix domain-containing protein n=1 Tax=Candidatus Jettenia caeni TaxID=247490 RepID=I3IGQ7_9BACT|nr:helix-turn-helix domain-containing protein [Candidatus Jettenia sp. AMX1]MBC6927866.1 helix-turn-helix domain-containing protein [Candidatus Jettenia sp.]WKZ16237.1 MAG: helix-turn-helix domain-containing protein [Candidatus Jettenia caeni]KAA0251274.1 MAG: DNA-binding protein [Candidatus Jettenia sp. AMX1]MCE7880298.1 helix-turn-helix domain-containing protein [Candidatus Jettenia sp. AMX1]MCQ3926169.1 helix-turn-helix domain-containing protein [Candidatus Jettenia sp.]
MELKTIEITNGLMDMNQTAAYINIKLATLYAITMRKEIPFVKIGKLNRFRKQDLDVWIDKNAQG